MYLEPADLWRKVDGEEDVVEVDARPIGGLMAPFVGHRYTVDEIWTYHSKYAEIYPQEEPELRPRAKRIRAFDIPALADTVFISHRLGDVDATIDALLIQRLPGIPWSHAPSRLGWAIKVKYALLHDIMPAPPDETTGQRMVIELYGRLEALDGQPVRRNWFNAFRSMNRDEVDALDLGEMRIRIKRATYANTRFPGIDVPFYM